MFDLFTEIVGRCDKNDALVDDMRGAGVAYAENEAAYRQALRLAIIEERAKGTPATIVGDIVRGREDIAALKQDRDIAESVYKSHQEQINVNKLRIRVLNDQLQREWTQAGQGGY